MSVIYYKFKAAKDSDYDVFTFDGPSATVFDLKREIIRAKKMTKDPDFDLPIYNAQTDEEYKDDNFLIPRNTSVIVRRLPPSRPGKGTAKRYVQGAAPVDGKGLGSSGIGIMKGGNQSGPSSTPIHNRGNLVLNAMQQKQPQQQQQPQLQQQQQQHIMNTFNSFQQQSQQDLSSAAGMNNMAKMNADDSEEARIQAMFQQTTEQWGATQEKLAEQQYIPYSGRGDNRRGRGGYHAGTSRTFTSTNTTTPSDANIGSNNNNNNMNANPDSKEQPYQVPLRVPPPNYVCYRCGQKGHYINQCPTNGDKDYDRHPRIKRTTGIPKSFLKVIEEPKDAVKSGTGGLMVTPKGDIVVAQADSSTWDQHIAKAVATSSLQGDLMEWYDSIPVPDYVKCPLSQGLMREATITPCCGTSFCDECIRNYLLENDFTCPGCQQQIRLGLDGLIPNNEVRQWIEHYVHRYATATREQQLQFEDHEQQQQQEEEAEEMPVTAE